MMILKKRGREEKTAQRDHFSSCKPFQGCPSSRFTTAHQKPLRSRLAGLALHVATVSEDKWLNNDIYRFILRETLTIFVL